MTARINGYKGQTFDIVKKIPFVSGGRDEVKLPQDVLIKEIPIFGKGKAAPTFAGAVPKLRPLGFADGLIKKLTLSKDGSTKAKSYDRMRKILHNSRQVFGQGCPDLFQVNSTVLSSPSQGRGTFGTTGQNTSFAFAFTLMMENKLSSNYGTTPFSTLGLQTAALEIEFGTLADLQDLDDVAAGTVVSSWAGDCEITISISCADAYLGDEANLVSWVENSQQAAIVGAQDGIKYYFIPEDELQGMLISYIKANGTYPTFEEMQSIVLDVSFDGTRLFKGTMLQLAQLSVLKGFKSEVERGISYWNHLMNSVYGTGLQSGVGRDSKPLEVSITCPSMPGVLMMEYDKIVRPRGSSVAPTK